MLQRELQFRDAEKKDIDSIIGLHEAAYRRAYESTGRTFDRQHLRTQLEKAIGKDITIVVEDKGRIVGFTWGKDSKDYWGNAVGEDRIVLVHPDYQNSGIGSKLIKLREARFESGDLRVDILTLNEGSRRLFERLGYDAFLIELRKIRRQE